MSQEKIKHAECDKAPIHNLGTIQPFGFVLIYTHQWQLLDYAGIIPFQITLDQTNTEPCETARIAEQLAQLNFVEYDKCCILYHYDNEDYDCYAHNNGAVFIVECLARTFHHQLPRQHDLLKRVKQITTNAPSLLYIQQEFVAMIAQLSGFNRVMMYCFDKDWNGEVVAEVKNNEMQSYLHHHFPATDIPEPVRNLYTKNPVRVIFSSLQESATFTHDASPDMSTAFLRGAVSIHRTYLQNMWVGASMSLSIHVNGKLWGLIACHHTSEKVVALSDISSYEFLSSLFSIAIENYINLQNFTERYQKCLELDQLRERVKDKLFSTDLTASFGYLIEHLCPILKVDAALMINQSGEAIASSNITINTATLTPFYQQLKQQTLPFICENTQRCHLELCSNGQYAGIVALEINIKNQKFILCFFRLAIEKTITWAGKPAKDTTSGHISPRHSFDAWLELKKDECIPFSDAEKQLILVLSNKIQDSIQRGLELKEQEELLKRASISFEKQRQAEYLALVEVMILTLDKQGCIKSINRKGCEILEYSEDELVGKNWFSTCIAVKEREHIYNIYLQVISGQAKASEYYENSVITKNGKLRLIAWHNTNLYDQDGSISGLLTSGEDISDKKNAENKLLKLNKKLEQLNKKLEKQAIIDPLTALYNRRHYNTVISTYLNTLARSNRYLGFLIVDIDNFKRYNDRYGHPEGDVVLKHVAHSLKKTLKRQSDAVFRLGGEEFGALVLANKPEDIVMICQRVLITIEQLAIEHKDNDHYGCVTISGGLRIVCCAEKTTSSALYRDADQALYQAKSLGRNQMVVSNNHEQSFLQDGNNDVT